MLLHAYGSVMSSSKQAALRAHVPPQAETWNEVAALEEFRSSAQVGLAVCYGCVSCQQMLPCSPEPHCNQPLGRPKLLQAGHAS